MEDKEMKTLTAIALATTTAITTIGTLSQPARADWGDFFLGVGAATGASIIINNNQKAEAQRYGYASPQQEYYRGVEDGVNRAKYDNPRNSSDYDRGYRDGLRRKS